MSLTVLKWSWTIKTRTIVNTQLWLTRKGSLGGRKFVGQVLWHTPDLDSNNHCVLSWTRSRRTILPTPLLPTPEPTTLRSQCSGPKLRDGRTRLWSTGYCYDVVDCRLRRNPDQIEISHTDTRTSSYRFHSLELDNWKLKIGYGPSVTSQISFTYCSSNFYKGPPILNTCMYLYSSEF